jgi:ABC-2 type transport system ATP-binding protein
MSTPVIWASQLSKDHVSGFFLKRTRILNAINLSIEKGQCFGLLGLNGSGKTTTLKLLLGLLAPSAGQVKVLDRPTILKPLKQSAFCRRTHISILT